MNCPYKAIKLAPGFYAVEESGVRVFLVEGDDEALLIDTGFGSGDLKSFLAEVTKLPVTRLINTHGDMDHVGCNHQFDSIWMHPAEFDRYCAGGQRSLEQVHPLWEGDKVTIGQRTFEVILISGHTPGSIALLDRENRILISGDTVQNDAIYMFGPGRNLPAFVHAIEKLEGMADQFDVVYPSHGDLTVSPDILPVLKQGAVDVMAGRVEAQPPVREGMPCKLYDCGAVKFLYDFTAK